MTHPYENFVKFVKTVITLQCNLLIKLAYPKNPALNEFFM